jgi:hypothetical protein
VERIVVSCSVRICCWASETADPSASPDFLLKLVALANFMRLSLLKGAHVALSCAAWQAPHNQPSRRSLRQHLIHYVAVNVCQPEGASLEFEGKLGVIESQKLQDRCVKIVHVNRVLSDVEA